MNSKMYLSMNTAPSAGKSGLTPCMGWRVSCGQRFQQGQWLLSLESAVICWCILLPTNHETNNDISLRKGEITNKSGNLDTEYLRIKYTINNILHNQDQFPTLSRSPCDWAAATRSLPARSTRLMMLTRLLSSLSPSTSSTCAYVNITILWKT